MELLVLISKETNSHDLKHVIDTLNFINLSLSVSQEEGFPKLFLVSK